MRFLHTADWQIGKPFQSIQDDTKREALRQQRLETIRQLGDWIRSEKVDFVVVCGDLFDSATPDQATVSALCSAVGSLEVPVYAIPGNHDFGGPGCIWKQEFFLREQEQLAPKFQILLESAPVVLDQAVLLPCPLLRRHESNDPTAWLRTEPEGLPEDLPRIILAHGSTQGFSSSGDSDQDSAINRINLDQLPALAYDYIALGDWHGMKEISTNAWFSGTPEQDRFAKGDNNLPGRVILVETEEHGKPIKVTPHVVGQIGWHELAPFNLTGDADLETLESQIEDCVGKRTGKDLLKVALSGSLSFGGAERLEQLIESLQSRLIRLRLNQDVQIEPTAEELEALTQSTDPLIAQVAASLQADSENDPLARDALRELHFQVQGNPN
jgi:DNA repair exonuclease SbcCD nuclease subunit